MLQCLTSRALRPPSRSATCAACHAKFDPVGLALENFDVMGRWRTNYRGLETGERISGIDRSGHDFAYTIAGAVDATRSGFARWELQCR